MSKTLVAKTEINQDVNLAIIKAFRITNKRAGEAKREGAESTEKYLQFCSHLRDLASQAEANDFNIWVNANGKTGHTYSKDYRQSNDFDNDYEIHIAEIQSVVANILEAK